MPSCSCAPHRSSFQALCAALVLFTCQSSYAAASSPISLYEQLQLNTFHSQQEPIHVSSDSYPRATPTWAHINQRLPLQLDKVEEIGHLRGGQPSRQNEQNLQETTPKLSLKYWQKTLTGAPSTYRPGTTFKTTAFVSAKQTGGQHTGQRLNQENSHTGSLGLQQESKSLTVGLLHRRTEKWESMLGSGIFHARALQEFRRELLESPGGNSLGIWLIVIIIVFGLAALFGLRWLSRRVLEIRQWQKLKKARSFAEHVTSPAVLSPAGSSQDPAVFAAVNAVLNKSKTGGHALPLGIQGQNPADLILDVNLGIERDNSDRSRGLTTEVIPEEPSISSPKPPSPPQGSTAVDAKVAEANELALRQRLRTRTRVLNVVSCSLGSCGRASVLGSPHSGIHGNLKHRHPHSPSAASEGPASPSGSITAAEIDHFSMDSLPFPLPNSPFTRFQSSNALSLDPRRNSGSSTSSARITSRSKRTQMLLSSFGAGEQGTAGEWLPTEGSSEGLAALERQLSKITVQSGEKERGGHSMQHTQSQVAASFEQFWLQRRRAHQRRELSTQSQFFEDFQSPRTHYYDIDNLLAQHRLRTNYPQIRNGTSRSLLFSQSIGSPSHSASLTPRPSSICDPSLSSITSPRSSQFNNPRATHSQTPVNPLHHVERHVPQMPSFLTISPVPPTPGTVCQAWEASVSHAPNTNSISTGETVIMNGTHELHSHCQCIQHGVVDRNVTPAAVASIGDASVVPPGISSNGTTASSTATNSAHTEASSSPAGSPSRITDVAAARNGTSSSTDCDSSLTADVNGNTTAASNLVASTSQHKHSGSDVSQTPHDQLSSSQPRSSDTLISETNVSESSESLTLSSIETTEGQPTIGQASANQSSSTQPNNDSASGPNTSGSLACSQCGKTPDPTVQKQGRVRLDPNPAVPALKLMDLDFDLEGSGVLGKGANGCVFKGTYQGQAVAVKVVSLHAKHRQHKQLMQLSKEAKVLSQVRHQHIVHLHGASLQHPWALLVEELMEFNLSDYIHRRAPVTCMALREVLLIGKCVSSALCALHPYIVHRDLKPQNVLLSQDGRVKLADFGLAFMMNTDQESQANFVAGTLPYIAPECFQGDDQKVTPKADIYSLGIMLCECLTQERPWMGLNKLAIAHQVVNKQARPRLPPAPVCPVPLRSLIEDCWQNDPDARPSAEVVYERLSQVEHSLKLTTV